MPKVSGAGQYVYVFLSYNFFITVCYTIKQAAGIALPTFMTRDKAKISTLMSFMALGVSVFAFIVSRYTMTLIIHLGGDQAAWIKLDIILASVAILTQLLLIFVTKEEVQIDAITGGKKQPLFAILKSLVQNKYRIIATIIASIARCIQTSLGITNTYYAQYIFNNVELSRGAYLSLHATTNRRIYHHGTSAEKTPP